MKTKMKIDTVDAGKIVQLNVDLPPETRSGLKMAALASGKALKNWSLEVLVKAAKEQLKEKGIPSNFKEPMTPFSSNAFGFDGQSYGIMAVRPCCVVLNLSGL